MTEKQEDGKSEGVKLTPRKQSDEKKPEYLTPARQIESLCGKYVEAKEAIKKNPHSIIDGGDRGWKVRLTAEEGGLVCVSYNSADGYRAQLHSSSMSVGPKYDNRQHDGFTLEFILDNGSSVTVPVDKPHGGVIPTLNPQGVLYSQQWEKNGNVTCEIVFRSPELQSAYADAMAVRERQGAPKPKPE